MTAADPIPDVAFYGPDCPICGESLDGCADAWTCDPCDTWWNADGTNGESFRAVPTSTPPTSDR